MVCLVKSQRFNFWRRMNNQSDMLTIVVYVEAPDKNGEHGWYLMFYAWRKLKLCDGMKALTRCALKCSVYRAQMILEYLFTSDVVGRQIDHRIRAQIGLVKIVFISWRRSQSVHHIIILEYSPFPIQSCQHSRLSQGYLVKIGLKAFIKKWK